MVKMRFLSTCLLILICFAFIAGCTRPQRQFARAAQLERSGQFSDAIDVYQKLLDEMPVREARARSQVYYRLGECLLRIDRAADAYKAFEHSVEAEPNNAAAQVRVGELLLAAGAAEPARQRADTALQIQPGSAEAEALLGGALAATGNNVQAKRVFQDALRSNPALVSAAVALADIYNRENLIDQARRVLLEAAAANPKRATPWLALGRLNEQEGDVSGAEHAYREAVAAEDTPECNLRLAQFLQRTTRINEAELVLRRVDAQRPTQPTAFADFELISGKAETALQYYQAALSSAANTSSRNKSNVVGSHQLPDQAVLATRLVEADITAASQKNRGDSKESLQKARAHLDEYRSTLDPATIAILQAEIASADSDLPMATTQANAAVGMQPHSAAAHYVLGLAKYRGGSKTEARAQWLSALESDVHFAPARLMLAKDALDSADAKSAEQHAMVVVRDEPGNLDALNLFAQALLAQDRLPAAAVVAKRALAVDASSAAARVVLGEVALREQRLGEALLQFEQAVLSEPQSGNAIDGLTRVYRSGKITRSMLARMEQIATAKPASATLMEIAGRLYADRGWTDDAKRALQATIRIDPQRASAAKMLARLYAARGQWSAAADSVAHTGENSAALLAGVRAQDRHDPLTAIKNYEQAIREGEHSGIAANNLAWLYVEQGINLDRALQLSEMARSLAPDNPAVLDTVGFVRLRMRKYSDAISALESARVLAGQHPSDPQLMAQIRHHLSEAYLKAGKTQASAAMEESVTQ